MMAYRVRAWTRFDRPEFLFGPYKFKQTGQRKIKALLKKSVIIKAEMFKGGE